MQNGWAAIPFNIFQASPPHVIAIVLGKGDRSVLQIVLDLFRLSTEKTQLFPCSSGKKVLDCEESVRWRTSLKLPPQDLRGTRNPSSAVLSRIREAKVHTLDAESACDETLNMKRKYSWLPENTSFREALPPFGARLMHPILLRRQKQEQTNLTQCTIHYQYLSLVRIDSMIYVMYQYQVRC